MLCADLVLGITGERSTFLDDFRAMKDGAIWTRGGSKWKEGDIRALTEAATAIKVIEDRNPLVQQPTLRFQIDGKWITIPGGGTPVNHDGSIQATPAEMVQLPIAALLDATF